MLNKHLLRIPFTSVPSERVFSTARDVVTAQRAYVLPKYVDMLVLLKKILTFNNLIGYVFFNMCSVVNYSTFYFDKSILVIIIHIRE